MTTVVHVRDVTIGPGVLEPDALYIGRAVPRLRFKASKWGNPYPVATNGIETSLLFYRAHVLATPELLEALPELVGKRLACWCKRRGDEPCHGDVLVDLLRERGLE